MDVLLPPPGETNDNNKRLAATLEKLNSKIDTFNKNIDIYNQNMIYPLPPQPKKLFIPRYMIVLLVVFIIFYFYNK